MRNARRLLTLLLLAIPLAYSTAAPVRANDPAPSLICHEGKECYPSVFQATDEFQTVHEDQELPPGLHYRLNIYTGEKEAKLLAKDEASGNAVVVGSHGEGGAEVEKVGGEVGEPVAHDIVVVPEPEEEISQEEAERRAMKKAAQVHTPEAQEFTTLLMDLNNHAKIPEDKLLESLSSLEDLAHSLDWGLELVNSQGLPDLLHLIQNSSSAAVRSSAAIVLGSSLSNNPKAVAASSTSKPNIVALLLSQSEKEKDTKVKGRLIYALDKAVKGTGLSDFKREKGIKILSRLASNSISTPDLVARIAVFIDDNFLNGDMQAEGSTFNGKPKEKMAGLGAFCTPFRKTLGKLDSRKDGSTREKILSAYLALRSAGEIECFDTVKDEGQDWVKNDL